MTTHRPLERVLQSELSGPDGYVRDCACGWRGVLWAAPQGADRAFLQHLVDVWRVQVGLPSATVVTEP